MKINISLYCENADAANAESSRDSRWSVVESEHKLFIVHVVGIGCAVSKAAFQHFNSFKTWEESTEEKNEKKTIIFQLAWASRLSLTLCFSKEIRVNDVNIFFFVVVSKAYILCENF